MLKYKSKIVDIIARRIFNGTISVDKGKIVDIDEDEGCDYDNYIIPGFIDAHVHIESSMLLPSAFAKLAVKSGTVAVLHDPHEIANVLGKDGVDFMIKDGHRVPFKFYSSVPSCVPATPFETAGAKIDSKTVSEMIQRSDIHFLGEMMNFPGVINHDAEVMRKIQLALAAGKVVDGHAPGLSGDDLKTYIDAGISTDHECSTLAEACEKLQDGMHVIIREGSAARNFDALVEILKDYSSQVMFCSDDKHPDDLTDGHINRLAARAVAKGYDVFDILRACSLNTIHHYGLEVGLLQKGDDADFVMVDNLKDFNVLSTYINGKCVFDTEKGYCDEFQKITARPRHSEWPNKFVARKITPESLRVKAQKGKMRIIGTDDGQILTTTIYDNPKVDHGYVAPDTANDYLKLIVYNRYTSAAPQVAFIHGFNLKHGAIASTIAHDSHNIIAVGTNDADLANAINQLIDTKGGIIAGSGHEWTLLPLPIAGLMSPDDGEQVAEEYRRINHVVSELGSNHHAPFMTLSFMALLVIPELKLSDKGFFDCKEMKFTSLFTE